MPNPDLSAEEFACFLNAETCNRIVNGTGKEARDVGVYDPKYDAVLIAQRDRDTLIKAADRYCVSECGDIARRPYCVYHPCKQRQAIIAPLAEGEKHGG